MHQFQLNVSHNGQQASQPDAQPHLPTQDNAQSHQRTAPTAGASHARFFPNLTTADFDPSVPLRLDTSTKPKIDLTGATILQPSKNPKDLGSLFSAAIDAQKGDTGKASGLARGKKKGATDEAAAQKPKSKTFGQLNEDYQRALAQGSSNPETGRDVAGDKADGASGGQAKKQQVPKPTPKPSTSPGSSKTDDPTPGRKADTALDPNSFRKLDKATRKALYYAFLLGALSTGTSSKQIKPMTREDMKKLMEKVPEFFIKPQEKSSHASSDPRSGFTPSPLPGPATAIATDQNTPSNTPSNVANVPMFDGSGSVQRIPSADAIQGQMENAMKGPVKTEPHRTPTPAQLALGDSGIDLALMALPQPQRPIGTGVMAKSGMNTPVTDSPVFEARTSPDESDGVPNSSPFQINGGRAHIDQEALREQTKGADADAEVTRPKRGRKRAASQASPDGEETENKPKRGKKAAAPQTAPDGEGETENKSKRGRKAAAPQASPGGEEETDSKPKRGRKRAASQAGEGEENKPKRKRTYKKKNAATPAAAAPAPTTVAESFAVPEPIGTTPLNTTFEIGASSPHVTQVAAAEQSAAPLNTTSEASASPPNAIPAESTMPSPVPTAAHSVATVPMEELESFVSSAPLAPLTAEQRAEFDAILQKTAARIGAAPGRAHNHIDLAAIDAQ